jgi:outer membrane receptor protein involved in Fe transport
MRSNLCWLVTLWLCALPVAAQPSTPTDTGSAPVATPAVAQEGTLITVVLAGRRLAFLPGVTVSASGRNATTNERGTAALQLPAGEHVARVELPGGAIELPGARVVAGEHTLVLATLSDDGKLIDASVQLPAPPSEPVGEPLAQPPAIGEAVGEPAPGAAGVGESALSGRILSTETGAPIANASVFVLGTTLEAQSDADGQFSIVLPPGSYTVSIVHLEHTGQTLEAIQVAAGATTELRIELTPAPLEMESFVVRARRIQGTSATVLEDRRKSAAVTDAISMEDIRKSSDGTASAATRRIVGASVVGGQYLFVRGLGGRYSNVRLNGIPLPSTDPDLPGFQLDLFPASLLASLTISKTFTPDIPGDFAGGSMNVQTRDFPSRFDLSASLGLSSDTETLGREVLDYPGGDLDLLGIDDGRRALPDEVSDRLVTNREVGPEGRARISRGFENVWETEPSTGIPNLSLGFSIGDTLEVAERRLGLLFTLGYRYNTSRYREEITDQDASGPIEWLEREVGATSAQTGLLGTASYEVTPDHDLTAVSLVTQTGDDQASLVTGRTVAEGAETERDTLRFVERRLLFNQLIGKHDLTELIVNWQLNMSSITRQVPDMRSIGYQESSQGFVINMRTNGERLYSELGETGWGGGVDLSLPIDDAMLGAGYLGSLSNRDYTLRSFENQLLNLDDERPYGDPRRLPPNELLSPDKVGDTWLITEVTRPRDGYDAEQILHAGYGGVDLPVLSWLRLTGGARVEAFTQRIDPRLPALGLTTGMAESLDRSDLDVLPAGSVILALSDTMNVRLAYGGTVPRPLLRELSPLPIPDPIRRRTVQGNPDLKRTYVHNLDARWEIFPSATEVLAASAFYKVFQDPIEPTAPSRSTLTYENVDSADNYGLELEARAGLDRFTDALEGLVLTANIALIKSKVTLSEAQLMMLTSAERPLAGQSPFIVNVAVAYAVPSTDLSLNVLYNVFGKRISEVGVRGLPDVYELPFHSLDFTASYQLDDHFTLAASATNLLWQETVLRQGDYDFSRIDRGMGFGIRLGYAN